MTIINTDLNTIIQTCKKAGVQTIDAYFNGGGDSGSLDELTLRPIPQPMPMTECTKIKRSYDADTKSWLEIYEQTSVPLTEYLTEYLYAEMERTGLDWCNNEGGDASWELDIETGELRFQVNIMTQRCEHWEETNVYTGAAL